MKHIPNSEEWLEELVPYSAMTPYSVFAPRKVPFAVLECFRGQLRKMAKGSGDGVTISVEGMDLIASYDRERVPLGRFCAKCTVTFDLNESHPDPVCDFGVVHSVSTE